ncbi:MAG TPA: VWA domain-containing protein, partial [Pseudolabrys sp.]
MSKDPHQAPAPVSSKPEIEAFVERVRALGPSTEHGKRGRLIFALDATMSRQPTWDTA